jgi:hypothetical protein
MRTFWMVLAGLTVLGAAPGSANAGERRSKTPSYDFMGEWRTEKGASPSISIVFRGKAMEVTVDGKGVAMTGKWIDSDGMQKFFHFLKLDWKGPYGGESYTEVGLIAGIHGSRDVLSGFYSELDHDPEGVEKRGFWAPVALYKVEPGGKKQPKR